MEGGVAIMSKSAVLSGSGTASRRDRGGGGGGVWGGGLSSEMSSGCLLSPWGTAWSLETRGHLRNEGCGAMTVVTSTNSAKWTSDSLG